MERIKVKLSDLGDIVGGATPSTINDDFYNGNIPWITPKDLSGHKERYIEQGERSISEAGLASCSTRIIPKGSILFSSRAPIGYVAIAKNQLCTNQGFKSIIPDDMSESLFIYYLLVYYKNAIEATASGTTFKEVSGSVMRQIEVLVPKSSIERESIAATLSCLDDKIELNNRIIANLEAQAQAIFKSWFVDFEPFQDGEFEDSELGMIPKGWKVVKLNSFFNVKTGKKDANIASACGKYPFFSCAQSILWTDDYSFDAKAILVAGNGDFNVKWYCGKFEAYQRTYVLIPENENLLAWLFYALHYGLEQITSKARGSVIKFITKGNIADYLVPIPQDLDKHYIVHILSSINLKIALCKQEISVLQILRDTLLPKLMSGEIEVPVEGLYV